MKFKCVIFASLVLAGCALQESPTSPPSPRPAAMAKDAAAALASTSQVIDGFQLTYTGRTVQGGNTTFSYMVTGIADGPALNQLILQIPACAGALVASSPNGGVVGTDQQSGLFGIKWGDVSVSNGEAEPFSVTFAGDLSEGLVRVAAKVGTTVSQVILPGPCQGFFITGTVFVDPDSSGTRDEADEPGILADVTVTLVDAAGAEQTTRTDASGQYSFMVLEGTYTLRIDATTAAIDFNEQLYDAFSATTSSPRTITITSDAPGNDFGFKPKAKEITADIELGVLFTNGMDRGFWTKVLRSASRGATYGGYDAPTVLGFLLQIETAFFPEPYTFTDGSELKEALAILTNTSKDPIALLYRELFVSELNDAAGLGLVNDPDLQDVLLSWGEALLVDHMAVPALGTPAPISPAKGGTIESDVGDATNLFNALNQRGGGDIPD